MYEYKHKGAECRVPSNKSPPEGGIFMQEIGHFPAFPQLFVEATEKLGQQEGGEGTDLTSSKLLQIWNNGAVETGAQKSGKGVWVGPPVQA